MRKFLTTMLLSLFSVTESGAQSWEEDPVESTVGIHIISNYGNETSTNNGEISKKSIHESLSSLDWKNDFFQVVLVKTPGISMEVGGSLDPQHGLSAMYRNRYERVEAVILNPPSTVQEMEDILLAFIESEEAWKRYEFNFSNY